MATKSQISLTATGAFANLFLVNAAGTSVQLRQTVTSDGLVVTSGNSLNDDFMAMPTRTLAGRDQTRTCLMPVPAGTTAADALAFAAALPAEACLWFRSSDDVRDLLGANQLAAMASGKSRKTIAEYEQSHSVTNPATGEVMPGLFRATFFSRTARADEDLRVASKPKAQPASLGQTAVAAVAAVDATPAPF